MVLSKMNKDNSDKRHQQHNKVIKDIQTTAVSQVCVHALLLTEYCLLIKVSSLQVVGCCRCDLARTY
jgi:hypothetical protein